MVTTFCGQEHLPLKWGIFSQNPLKCVGSKTLEISLRAIAHGFESHPLRQKPSHIKALRPYDWAFLFANLPLLHMIFGKKSCLPSDGLGFRQSQDIVHYICRGHLGLVIQVGVDVRRGADVAVAQPLLDLLQRHIVRQKQ